jgi:hypothetical protein
MSKLRTNELTEPSPRIFDVSVLGSIIQVDQPKPRPEAFVPFKVIHEAPDKITLYRDSFLFGAVNALNMLL